MKVSAAPGTRCPKEGKPREYITDNIPEEVPDSAYYRRLVADGSLVPAASVADANTGSVSDKSQETAKVKGGNK
jgi:hypothetical protein